MSKFDNTRNPWTPEEDAIIIKGRAEGLSARQIKEKYFKDSDRNRDSINSRFFRLRGVCPKRQKQDVYWIKTGLEGLVFEMEKPTERLRWSAQGSAAQTIHGHLV